MAAVTLVDELTLEQPLLRKGIVKTLVEAGQFQSRIPFNTTGALSVPIVYISGVPTATLRFLNETVTTQKAQFAQLVENLSIIDEDIDIDPVLLDNKNQVQNVQVAQTEAVVQAIAYRINDLAIDGNPVTDAREPSGLRYRLAKDNRFNGQTVNATANATKLSAVVGTATDANLRSWLNKMDVLHKRCDNKTSLFLMNEQAELAFWALLRQLKLLDTTKDQFDRDVSMYRGVPFIDMGYKAVGAVTGSPAATDSQGDQVIGNDSDDASGSNPQAGNGANAYTVFTPIYAVRFGDNYLTGLQQTSMRVKPFGETEATPHLVRTNIRWVVHPTALFQKRAAARLVGMDIE